MNGSWYVVGGAQNGVEEIGWGRLSMGGGVSGFGF